jgi:uncharacterized pyridoxamine 5'-phosphate oxidase family protein
MSKINDYLNETNVFFLATVDGNQPRIRPLGAHLEMDGKIMFGVGDFKDVYKQMKSNPQVEIVACKQDGHWLRYTGTAVFETDYKYAELKQCLMLRRISATFIMKKRATSLQCSTLKMPRRLIFRLWARVKTCCN